MLIQIDILIKLGNLLKKIGKIRILIDYIEAIEKNPYIIVSSKRFK